MPTTILDFNDPSTYVTDSGNNLLWSKPFVTSAPQVDLALVLPNDPWTFPTANDDPAWDNIQYIDDDAFLYDSYTVKIFLSTHTSITNLETGRSKDYQQYLLYLGKWASNSPLPYVRKIFRAGAGEPYGIVIQSQGGAINDRGYRVIAL